MRLQYRLVNVFARASGKLTGNPLCVFEDGGSLTAEQMQALALQFNLSETTFILPSRHASARVRIFTPTFEMPFAGHPTLGTAHVVRSLINCGDQLSLEMQAGVIPVVAAQGVWELKANAATVRKPLASWAEIALALGLTEADIKAQPLHVNSGSEQFVVPLASVSAVERVSISVDRLRAVTLDGARVMAYVFAEEGAAVKARFFFSMGSAIAEDPATGSAAANLGGWYLATNAVLPMLKTISQGEQIGRPSTLRLRIDADRNVYVAGEVIELGGGFVDL